MSPAGFRSTLLLEKVIMRGTGGHHIWKATYNSGRCCSEK